MYSVIKLIVHCYFCNLFRLQQGAQKSNSGEVNGVSSKSGSTSPEPKFTKEVIFPKKSGTPLFSDKTRSIVWGMQTRAVQVG